MCVVYINTIKSAPFFKDHKRKLNPLGKWLMGNMVFPEHQIIIVKVTTNEKGGEKWSFLK